MKQSVARFMEKAVAVAVAVGRGFQLTMIN